MTEKDNDSMRLDVPLSDKETYFIGQIVATYGAIEHTIFMQTVATYENQDGSPVKLPKAMGNMSFTAVLTLWRDRVANVADDERKVVLLRQYDRISELHPFRNALVHGMWEWAPEDLKRITSVRISKDQLISVHFDLEKLADYAARLSGIRFKINYPGGIEDLAQERMATGYSFGRSALGILTGDPIAEDWLANNKP